MPQTQYTVNFIKFFHCNLNCTLFEIIYDLLYKRNSRTFKHLDQKSAVFQGFQGLEKPVMNFKYFQALQGPVQTLVSVITLSKADTH